MIKKLLIIFIIFDATQFFSLSFFSDNTIKIFDVISIFFIVIILSVYKFRELIIHIAVNKGLFKRELFIILIAVFLSFFGAAIYHGQSFFLSFISSRFMYFYLLYFLLVKFNLEVSDLEKIITIFAISYSIIYFVSTINP